jgi:hypothetical protein
VSDWTNHDLAEAISALAKPATDTCESDVRFLVSGDHVYVFSGAGEGDPSVQVGCCEIKGRLTEPTTQLVSSLDALRALRAVIDAEINRALFARSNGGAS